MKYTKRYFKLFKKYVSRWFDLIELQAQYMSLKMDMEQLKRYHEKEIKQKEEEIRKLSVKHETQLKRNEILRRDNLGMYHLTKKYQKKVRTLNEKINKLEGKTNE